MMKFLRLSGQLVRLLRYCGLGFLVESIRDFIDLQFIWLKKPPLKVVINGLSFYGFLRHRSFLERIAIGAYETYLCTLFKQSLSSGMTVVDGGAYIGYYSLLAAKELHGSGQIFAFEPDPYNFLALAINVYKNRYSNVTPIPKALADRQGYAPFYQASSTVSSSLSYRNGISRRCIKVQLTTLDRELGGIPVGDILIKLDIEGSEPLALQGMKETIKRSRSAVLFTELNLRALHSAGFKPENLLEGLRDIGFEEIYFIDEINSRLLPITDTIPYDVLAHMGCPAYNLYCKRG